MASLSLQARSQQIPAAAAEVAGALPEETMDTTGESDLSSVSTLSKLSSNVSKLTEIDGQSWDCGLRGPLYLPCQTFVKELGHSSPHKAADTGCLISVYD